MFYEERVIDGKLMCRSSPDGEWREIDYGMLSNRVIAAETLCQELTRRAEVVPTQEAINLAHAADSEGKRCEDAGWHHDTEKVLIARELLRCYGPGDRHK